MRSASALLAAAWSALAIGCVASLNDGGSAPRSIARSEHVAVDGARLYLETRGRDERAPVLLWLHGGPGGPERPLLQYFNGELERQFVVAYWDQRGAGRSFDPDADPHDLTVARHLADLDAIVDHLRAVLGRDRLALVGHSWGAALALLYARAHPEKVAAVVAVCPLVSLRKAQQAEWAFVSAEAAARRDETTLARLRKLGPPPYSTATQELAMESLADRHGALFHRPPNRLWILVRGIGSGLVTPWELPRFFRANDLSLDAMIPELLELDLAVAVPRLEVPVSFFLGRYDRHLDATLAASYFEALAAPAKRLVWFEQSAHNVPFEEPQSFNAEVARVLHGRGLEACGDQRKVRMPAKSPDGRPERQLATIRSRAQKLRGGERTHASTLK